MDDVGGGVGHRQGEKPGGDPPVNRSGNHVGRRAVGEVHVTNHHIGFGTHDGVDGVGHGAGLGHHLDVAVHAFLKLAPDPGSDQSVVVDKCYSDHDCS